MGEFGLKCGPTKGYTDQIRVISVLESYNVSVSYPLTSKFLNQFITKGLIMLGSEEKCGVRLILPYPVQGGPCKLTPTSLQTYEVREGSIHVAHPVGMQHHGFWTQRGVQSLKCPNFPCAKAISSILLRRKCNFVFFHGAWG